MKLNKLFLALILGGLMACNTPKDIDSTYANYNFETQHVKTDGSIVTLRTWGKGNDKNDALDQARKNALRTLIFKGVTAGVNGGEVRPILLTVNAEEKYRDYFNKFFSTNGPWKEFVKIDEKMGGRKVSRNSEIENWETTVTVDTDKLIGRLTEDNILMR